jgi:predicted small metal-binding protein
MKIFSTAEVRHWIGSDHTSSDELIELITELVNKEYPIDQIREDIINSDLGDGSLEDEEDLVSLDVSQYVAKNGDEDSFSNLDK